MAWQISGQLLDTCSCKLLCPCILGPAEPDQGWCSGALAFDIQQGSSVMAFDMPGDFIGGNLTAASTSVTRRLRISAASLKRF